MHFRPDHFVFVPVHLPGVPPVPLFVLGVVGFAFATAVISLLSAVSGPRRRGMQGDNAVRPAPPGAALPGAGAGMPGAVGAVQSITCRACGTVHPPFARYCRRCGNRL